MCYLLGCFKGKLEGLRGSRPPGLDSLRGWHPIKGVIDLHAVQAAGVILEELLLRQTFGIEDWTPFLIAETGRAEPDRRHWRIIAQVVSETPVNIDRYAQDSQKSGKTGGF